MRRLRRHAAPRLEAPRHLRRGGARVLRVAQRPHARAELAGRPRGQLRPGAEAPHRVLLGLRRALLHVQGREAGAGAANGARALPGRGEADPAAHPRERSSSSELDGVGADFSQAFAYEGGMVWDFVYARRLLSNGTYRPIHDAVLGFEHCMVAKARRILNAPPRWRGASSWPPARAPR